MTILGVCKAYVDLIVTVSDNELATLGFNKGACRELEVTELVGLVETYLAGANTIAGGPVANSIAVVKSLGGQAGFIGVVGNDELGKHFLADLKHRAVNWYGRTENSGSTACCLIFVTPDGERTILFNSGVAGALRHAELPQRVDLTGDVSWLFLGLLFHDPALAEAITRVKELFPDAKVATTLQDFQISSADPSRVTRLLSADLLFGNRGEYQELLKSCKLTELTGLSRKYPDKTFVCTQGKDGAEILLGDQRISIPAIVLQKVVDTTGAGDAWAGGFLFGLSTGRSIYDSGLIGATSAAKIIGHFGGRPR